MKRKFNLIAVLGVSLFLIGCAPPCYNCGVILPAQPVPAVITPEPYYPIYYQKIPEHSILWYLGFSPYYY